MISWKVRRISDFFNPRGSEADDADVEIIESTMTPVAGSGAVIMLPAGNSYTANDLKHIFTAQGGSALEQIGYYRIISSDRAWAAAESGTDRTSESTVHTIRSDNKTMDEHGITNPAEVTYLHPFEGTIPALPEGQSALVYSTRGIRNIRTSDPSVPFPNDKLFHFTGDPRDSLLAIITNAPRLSPTEPLIVKTHTRDGPS